MNEDPDLEEKEFTPGDEHATERPPESMESTRQTLPPDESVVSSTDTQIFQHTEILSMESPIENSSQIFRVSHLLENLGKAIDSNLIQDRSEVYKIHEQICAEIRKAVEILTSVVRSSAVESRDAINAQITKEAQLQADLQQSENERQQMIFENGQLLQEIQKLKSVDELHANLVAKAFHPLLDSLDEDRKNKVRSILLLLFSSGGNPNKSLLAELTDFLGTIVHQSKQPPALVLANFVDELNQEFKKNDTALRVRLATSGSAIDQSFMDGNDLGGKRTVADASSWALFFNEKLIKRAQISGQ